MTRSDEARAVLRDAVHRIAPEVDLDTIDPDADLQEELDIDSVDFLNLVVGLHDRLGIDIPERDYPQLSTLTGAVAYLAARTS